ncbi:MAG: hypothetical protein U0271_00680 [Polyangiaceae bacterium]
MGASGWDYWVPYESDIGSALAKLREKAFAEGDYYKGFGEYQVKSPTSIDDLFKQMEEVGLSTEGAHSILDMERVGETPDFAVVAPLTDDQLDALFDTTKPTRAQVEAEKSLIESLRERWEGTYIVAYEGDTPKEIFFVGFSGD